MKFYVSKAENIDNTSLRWQKTYDDITLPIACKIDDKIYNINFANGDEYIIFDVKDFTEAINLSIKYAKNIKFTDIARLSIITKQNGVNNSDISLFKEMGIKGDKSFEVLQSIVNYPEDLQAYIDEKNIPIKTLRLISSLHNNCIKFIADFVADISPSLQAFKIFVENVADFKEEICNATYVTGFSFPSKKSAVRKDIEQQYADAKASIAPALFINSDMFETSNISISFNANSLEEYKSHVEKLSNYSEVATFYELLKKNGIC